MAFIYTWFFKWTLSLRYIDAHTDISTKLVGRNVSLYAFYDVMRF
jgi:hypothetical protein